MPSTTLILNGYSFLDGIKVNVNPHGGYQGGGQVTVKDGTLPFEADDIIVIGVDNADANLEVTVDSYITTITVYDSAADYYAANPKFEYIDTSGGANVSSSTSGLGDRHLRFNGNNMLSTDPGAPDLQQVMLGAGIDFTTVTEGGTVVIDRLSDNDYNGDSVINPGTVEEANGAFATENNVLTMICFARGTQIDAPDGPRYVESLRKGDWVNTLDNGRQQIRWIGSRKIIAEGRHAPIVIKAGALGNIRDLKVSQNHRMLVNGAMSELYFGHSEVLVAAKHLIDGVSILIEPQQEIEYFHILFAEHQIVFAEACPCESLFPGKEAMKSVTDDARAEIIELFPQLEHLDAIGQTARYTLSAPEASVWAASTRLAKCGWPSKVGSSWMKIAV